MDASQKFELTPHHVVVPLSFFDRVMEFYYLHRRGTPGEEPELEPQSPHVLRPQDMNLAGAVPFDGPPPGYKPRGVAVVEEAEDDDGG